MIIQNDAIYAGLPKSIWCICILTPSFAECFCPTCWARASNANKMSSTSNPLPLPSARPPQPYQPVWTSSQQYFPCMVPANQHSSITTEFHVSEILSKRVLYASTSPSLGQSQAYCDIASPGDERTKKALLIGVGSGEN